MGRGVKLGLRGWWSKEVMGGGGYKRGEGHDCVVNMSTHMYRRGVQRFQTRLLAHLSLEQDTE